MKHPYGIGLDIGIASVGWAVVALNENAEPYGLIRCGSRIFDKAEQPQKGDSLAAPRREARSARRRLRRRSLRKAAGRTVDFETELLAYAADRLTQVLWWLHNDTSKPPSVLADLCGEADTSNVQCYASAEEFDAALAALKGG